MSSSGRRVSGIWAHPDDQEFVLLWALAGRQARQGAEDWPILSHNEESVFGWLDEYRKAGDRPVLTIAPHMAKVYRIDVDAARIVLARYVVALANELRK